MDTFEAYMEKIEGMDTTERATELHSLQTRCTCTRCPSYNECMRENEELLFCMMGKSPACTFEKRGCTCPPCPVTILLQLKKGYYCLRGTEQQQRSRAIQDR